jgi:cyclophilin family peptidyl-prolyl cis-trans isomerase
MAFQDIPPYFVKLMQDRTLYANNEPVRIIFRLGNQSERGIKQKKLPDTLESLIVTRDGERLAMRKDYSSQKLYRRLDMLDMGAHKDFRLDLKKLFPDMTPGAIYKISYKDDIYEFEGQDIQIANVALPDLDATFVLNTGKGDIGIKLDNDYAPNHARNFAILVAMDFYRKQIFHRVEPGFVIQTGDPLGNGTGGSGFPLTLEKSPFVKHKKYAVGMARGDDLGSATSQFYICLEDTPPLDGSYTVFGRVVSGFDVVDAIGKVETTGPRGEPPAMPLEDVDLHSIEIKAAE